ncbi:hypothetical protein ACIPUB_09910 [Paeniglutamicibacter sp. ORCA_105]|uniref:hypothetical protein n=1 Tax=Paeniglutamicibacter sp. ORCA_105 TaxID=3377336 RepID=UPI00389463CC
MPRLNGEQHHQSKLTEREVLMIRQQYVPGQTTMLAISEAFGVSRETISLIVNRKTWRWLPEDD